MIAHLIIEKTLNHLNPKPLLLPLSIAHGDPNIAHIVHKIVVIWVTRTPISLCANIACIMDNDACSGFLCARNKETMVVHGNIGIGVR